MKDNFNKLLINQIDEFLDSIIDLQNSVILMHLNKKIIFKLIK